MKLPMQWAKDYAKFETSSQEFADRMTMSGSKVETWESEADDIQNVVIGKVEKLDRHEDSDHLWVCQIDVGSETIQIVTGAQNLTVGDIIPVAMHGAKLPGDVEIKRGKLRGVESNGMLIGLAELGLTTHDFPYMIEDGIMVLGNDTANAEFGEVSLGDDVVKVLGLDDITVEFEITPNRPDCLSAVGLAREAAATYEVPFEEHIPAEPTGEGDIANLLRVKVEATDTCMRYSAAMVDNVRIKPSPLWMRKRLRNAGVRPINNIVDITNYVMLEYGQPMHAFDYAYVNGGAITVRKATDGETIVTLDDIERKLTPNMMVIADDKGPIALAGIMGGEYSGVYDSTKKVVFESAAFDGPSVRATSRAIGLRTESSTRFEKGLDPETVGLALRRALELVVELDAGDLIGGILDDYPSPRKARVIPFNPEAVNVLLGTKLNAEDMVKILTPLGFVVKDGMITVPTFRYDVARDCDIAEEVARFVGYNNFAATVLEGAAEARRSPRQQFDDKVSSTLVGYGLWQCETFSFYSPKGFDLIRLPQDSALRNAIKILHPLGEDTSIMRTTTLPSMMEVVARNWAARTETAALYEQATEYLPNEDPELLPYEKQKIILAAYGTEWDYFALKGVLESLLETIHISNYEVARAEASDTWHPGRCADVYLVERQGKKGVQRGAKVGTIGEIHPTVCANYGIKARVVAADIDLDLLFEARGGTPQYTHLPKFPATTRDLAVVASNDIPAAEIAGRITRAAGNNLESLTLFDVYTGEKLGEGKKSLAYSLVLRSKDSTLTDEDADRAVAKVLKSLGEIGVELRS